ncbi:MAG: RagB/SusD family nutrient uptake outer membrane protein [Marinilabiliaceae bacterium]|nr:RagB/SusD family nutrient uptake outer membrane protein [Marinilabiliaceae bacterium]
MKYLRILTLFVVTALLLASCEKYLEVDPVDQVNSEDAIVDAASLKSAVFGIYSTLQLTELYGTEFVEFGDLQADVSTHSRTYNTWRQMDNNSLMATNLAVERIWRNYYIGINRANNVLLNITELKDQLNDEQKLRFSGEAHFLRAFFYFDLVKCYGGVPLELEPTGIEDINNRPTRNSVDDIYGQIFKDLKSAESELAGLGAETGRVSEYTVKAFLARVNLYRSGIGTANLQDAIDEATEVIESDLFKLKDNYKDVWETKHTNESIFELDMTKDDDNAMAFFHFPPALGGRRESRPADELIEALDAADERGAFYIGDYDGSPYSKKYFRVDIGDDNVPVIRLSEMYLIRAEANARLAQNMDLVIDDLNEIRNRANLEDTPADAYDALILAIEQERMFEFAFEGHRWFDLVRTNRAIAVLDNVTSMDQYLWPIPQRERDINSNLSQNPGY